MKKWIKQADRTKIIEILVIAAMLAATVLAFNMAFGSYDQRALSTGSPVARLAAAQQSWATGAGHAAASDTIQFVNGTIYRIDAIISSVTDNPTVAVTFRDQNSVVIIPDALCAALADGTNHIFLAESNKGTPDADFNPLPHSGNVTVSVDPSADPGGAGQTLTVDVILYVR